MMNEGADDRIFRRDEIAHEEREGYRAVCQLIREACGRKTDCIDFFLRTYYIITTNQISLYLICS